MANLEYVFRRTSYTFKGGKLPSPPVGSYDVDAWTPPSHRTYLVEVQDDGFWQLLLNGAEIKTGEGGSESKAFARAMVLLYAPEFNP